MRVILAQMWDVQGGGEFPLQQQMWGAEQLPVLQSGLRERLRDANFQDVL